MKNKICKKCGLTRKEHKEFTIFGYDDRYCTKFKVAQLDRPKNEGCGKDVTIKSSPMNGIRIAKFLFKCGVKKNLCQSCRNKNTIKKFEKVGQANFGSKGKLK